MAQPIKSHSTPFGASGVHLRVAYADADRLRARLRSKHTALLRPADIRTLLLIIDDVYPTRRQRSWPIWQPVLIGVSIGIGLLWLLTW